MKIMGVGAQGDDEGSFQRRHLALSLEKDGRELDTVLIRGGLIGQAKARSSAAPLPEENGQNWHYSLDTEV